MSKNIIVCLCIGSLYTDEYVQRLSRMVARHLTVDYKFVCYSDRQIEGIDTILISDTNQLEPVWYKLQMLALPELTQYQRKVFFDLDVVIHSNIDWVFEIEDPSLHVVESKWKTQKEATGRKNTGCNSSVMIWQNAASIYEQFMLRPDYYMMFYVGIDRFLWNERPGFELIPNDEIYSYREGASLNDRIPFLMRPSKSICIYNGDPKPIDCINHEPAKTHWR